MSEQTTKILVVQPPGVRRLDPLQNFFNKSCRQLWCDLQSERDQVAMNARIVCVWNFGCNIDDCFRCLFGNAYEILRFRPWREPNPSTFSFFASGWLAEKSFFR